MLETLIFQVSVVELSKRLKIGNVLIIVISSLFFAIAHHDTILYMLMTIFPGIIYAYYYLYNRVRGESWTIAALYVFLLHSLYNLTIFVLDNFQKS